MLYGVAPDLRNSIIDKGHVMRVYVPFGKDWFGHLDPLLEGEPEQRRSHY